MLPRNGRRKKLLKPFTVVASITINICFSDSNHVCTFENKDKRFCDWTQSDKDIGGGGHKPDWAVYFGPPMGRQLGTHKTGPAVDHTLGTDKGMLSVRLSTITPLYRGTELL